MWPLPVLNRTPGRAPPSHPTCTLKALSPQPVAAAVLASASPPNPPPHCRTQNLGRRHAYSANFAPCKESVEAAAVVPCHSPARPCTHGAHQISLHSLALSALLLLLLLPAEGPDPSIFGVPLPCLVTLYTARKIQRYRHFLPPAPPPPFPTCGWQLIAAGELNSSMPLC